MTDTETIGEVKNGSGAGSGGDGGVSPSVDGETPHDAVGAFLLDALPDDEREQFVVHLAGCAICQRDVAELTPLVGVFPLLDDWEPVPDRDAESSPPSGAGAGPAVLPSDGLRDRILAAARAEANTTTSELPTPFGREVVGAQPVTPDPRLATPDPDPILSATAAETEVETHPAPPSRLSPGEPSALAGRVERPRGRIRAGVDPLAGPTSMAATPWQRLATRGGSWLAAAVLAVVAVGAILWALGLQSRLDDTRDEIGSLRDELRVVQARESASVYNLGATPDGPTGATGRLVYTPGVHMGTFSVQGLPNLPETQLYQLWYIAEGETPLAGPTFRVNPGGTALVAVETEATFSQIAVTAEPLNDPQPANPTAPILLSGGMG